MRRALPALLVLAGCREPVLADCHFRNAECSQGSYCAGHQCRPAGSSYGGDITFLVTPADGSWQPGATAEDPPRPLVPTAIPDPGGPRRLVACPTTAVTIDSPFARYTTGVGRPAEGLPLETHVEALVGAEPPQLHLAPGSWTFLVEWLEGDATPPLTTTLQIGNCLAAAKFAPRPDNRPERAIQVSLFVDRDRDRRAFCDARIDVVDGNGTLRARPILLTPGCEATHVLTATPDPAYFVRVQPRPGSGDVIPTQLVPLALEPMELSAVGAPGPPRRLEVHVLDAAGDPVEPVELFAEGKVLAGTRPWPPSAEKPATFGTRDALPVAGQRGTYSLDLVSGCYRIHAVPPAGSRSGVGDSDPPGTGDPTPPTVCDEGSFLFDGSTLPDPTPKEWFIHLPDRVTLSGSVLAGSGPVSGTRVTAIPVDGSGREVSGYAGEDGAFTLSVDPDTRYDLLLQPPAGLGLPWDRVQLERNESSRTTILPEAVPLIGSVSRPTGEALPRALVQAFERPLATDPRPLGEAVTDADGNFTLILPVPARH